MRKYTDKISLDKWERLTKRIPFRSGEPGVLIADNATILPLKFKKSKYGVFIYEIV